MHLCFNQIWLLRSNWKCLVQQRDILVTSSQRAIDKRAYELRIEMQLQTRSHTRTCNPVTRKRVHMSLAVSMCHAAINYTAKG